jgi:hypothetical protein
VLYFGSFSTKRWAVEQAPLDGQNDTWRHTRPLLHAFLAGPFPAADGRRGKN